MALRADAVRNRRAIVETAQRLYGDRGLEASLDEISRLAGVGNATLYRHFPTRCELVAAVFADTLQQVVDSARRALDVPDAWDGFAGHVRFLCRLQATDRAFADLVTIDVSGAPSLERLRNQAHRGLIRLSDRAKAAGRLRADFVTEDLVVLLMANAGVVHRTACTAPDAWNRFIELALDGLRPTPTACAARPTKPAVLRRAMNERGRSLGFSGTTTGR